MTIRIVPATAGHVDELHAGMREQDLREVYAVSGHLSAHEMRQHLLQNESYAALDASGRLICIFGCGPAPARDSVGVPWMLGTDRLDRHIFSMCRQARAFIDKWHAQYEVLTNATDVENRKVILWLRWLGFKMLYTFPAPRDPEVTFITFSKERPCATPSALRR